MLILSKGQKADLTKGRNVREITFEISWHAADPDIDINASAFLLESGGKCARDEDFIFYVQQMSRKGAVVHAQTSCEGGEEIRIRVADIPGEIEKIAITLTIHDGEIIGKSFGQVTDADCRIRDSGTGEQLGLFRFGEGLQLETAIVVGEFGLVPKFAVHTARRRLAKQRPRNDYDSQAGGTEVCSVRRVQCA